MQKKLGPQERVRTMTQCGFCKPKEEVYTESMSEWSGAARSFALGVGNQMMGTLRRAEVMGIKDAAAEAIWETVDALL